MGINFAVREKIQRYRGRYKNLMCVEIKTDNFDESMKNPKFQLIVVNKDYRY